MTTFFFRPVACLLCAAAAGTLFLAGCEGGHLNILGYTTRPVFDENIRTVYVPIFKNKTFYKGMEFDLTQAIVRQIEARTPYKVVSDPDCADTILTGTIVAVNKNLLNVNQLNEIRQAETTLTVTVDWCKRDNGESLIRSQPGPIGPPITPQIMTAPGEAPEVMSPVETPLGARPLPAAGLAPPPKPAGITMSSNSSYIPELGQSTTSSFQGNVDRLAIQIVAMMEEPW